MSEGGGSWQDGHRAWERLNGWLEVTPSTGGPQHPDDGDGALNALADVGLVRRLLDRAELVAVRTARRHGRSWAEIATQLGVSRQSAWERWRDLDETGGAGAAETAVSSAAAAAVEGISRAPALRRRSAKVSVPGVVGMSWDDARTALLEHGLVPVAADPDGLPVDAQGYPQGVVTDQAPEGGARVAPGATVRLWLDRGGGSGVREPRRPIPEPRTGRAMRDELSDEAV